MRKLAILEDNAAISANCENYLFQPALIAVLLSKLNELHKHKFEHALVLLKCALKLNLAFVNHANQVTKLDNVRFENGYLSKNFKYSLTLLLRYRFVKDVLHMYALRKHIFQSF